MRFLDEVKKLDLPSNEFAIFGSGPLAIRKLREANDIDLIVKEILWKKLLKKYAPTEKGNEIKIGNVSIFHDWPGFLEVESLIDEADIINGIRYVKLEKVLQWKQKRNFEKDRKDIELLEKNLKK